MHLDIMPMFYNLLNYNVLLLLDLKNRGNVCLAGNELSVPSWSGIQKRLIS